MTTDKSYLSQSYGNSFFALFVWESALLQLQLQMLMEPLTAGVGSAAASGCESSSTL